MFGSACEPCVRHDSTHIFCSQHSVCFGCFCACVRELSLFGGVVQKRMLCWYICNVVVVAAMTRIHSRPISALTLVQCAAFIPPRTHTSTSTSPHSHTGSSNAEYVRRASAPLPPYGPEQQQQPYTQHTHTHTHCVSVFLLRAHIHAHAHTHSQHARTHSHPATHTPTHRVEQHGLHAPCVYPAPSLQ